MRVNKLVRVSEHEMEYVLSAQAGAHDQPLSLHQIALVVANLGSSPGAPPAYPPLHPVAGLPTVAVPCAAQPCNASDLSATDGCGTQLHAHAAGRVHLQSY